MTEHKNIIKVMQELILKNEKTDMFGDLLEHYYLEASLSEKEFANKICVCLCGRQLDTIIDDLKTSKASFVY